MPVRMTGMISGLDTETLIQSMIEAQRLKNKKVEDKKTLLEWKQEQWKELNSKLYKLYTDDLNRMRLSGNYMTKTVTSSNENLVSVNAKATAATGTHTIQITELASSQSLTGGQLANATSSTRLTDLGVTAGTIIKISHNGKNKTLEVTAKTTIADFVSTAKSAGLNASFDEKYGRLYISSKNSGTANSFQITATATAEKDKEQILSLAGYNNLSEADKAIIDNALTKLSSVDPTEVAQAKDTLKSYAEKEVERQVREEVEPGAKEAEITKMKEEVLLDYLTDKGITEEDLTDEQRAEIETLQEDMINSTDGQDRINKAVNDALDAVKAGEDYDKRVNTAKTVLSDVITSYQNQEPDGKDVTTRLEKMGLGSLARVIPPQDSIITYNEVEYIGSSNVFDINGMEITLKGKAEGETIYLNVANNTQGIYDMVKKFVTSYNDILKEMNDYYYAESARGYDPLTDDERDAMSEKEIEKWEKKIKDSLLRNDTTLGSLLGAMKNAMMTTVEVGDKKYSLSSFGIQTSKDYTEKGLLHIDGDKEDSLVADRMDKLMKALEEDPDTVMEVLTKISQKLYDTMYDKMKAIPNVRSALTFYNDKTMAKQMTEYTKKVAKLESDLLELEDKYYKQFAQMESALAKLQSQTNALASMLGTTNR